MISFIKRMSEVLQVRKIVPNGRLINENNAQCRQIMSYPIHGPLFVGAADQIESMITRLINERPKVLILKMRHVSLIDVTSHRNLACFMHEYYHRHKIDIITVPYDCP